MRCLRIVVVERAPDGECVDFQLYARTTIGCVNY